MRQPGKMLEGRAFSSGRATPENAVQAALPQKSDVSPRAVTPRKARRPYGRESSGGLSCGVSISARYRREAPAGLRIAEISPAPLWSVRLDDEPAVDTVAEDLRRRVAAERVERPAVERDLRPPVGT